MAHIKTYARIKPTLRQYGHYEHSRDFLYIRVPENLRDLGAQPSRPAAVSHQFKFGHVFPPPTSQEEVFNAVAKEIVDGFLTGYNGTIFAYGQTGSGKTFTVQGSARRYDDRGLAPRAISRIYQELSGRQDEEISVYVSYMEIYQEIGYDLLSTATRATLVTTFPKVAVVEGPNGSCLVRNLSSHLAANEDVAQSLLLQGQANRKVAETPMNQRSSRSHAVFTVQLRAKKPGSDVLVRSKLHLVDLAGSERVSKTGIEGAQLSEAKFINLSLHHLESVIISLQKESSGGKSRPKTPNMALSNRVSAILSNRPRSSTNVLRSWANSIRPSSASSSGIHVSGIKHIPYRNSLLTMLLRDSLGGNCQTAMIATVSMEEENLSETLSTCRFAQRVACITNMLRKNEEIDDRTMVRRLRKRIAELEKEVSILRESQCVQCVAASGHMAVNPQLSEEDKQEVIRIMQDYLTGRITDPVAAGVTTALRYRESIKILRFMILKHYGQPDGTTITSQNLHALMDSTASVNHGDVELQVNQSRTSGPADAWPENSKSTPKNEGIKPVDQTHEKNRSKPHRLLPARPKTSSIVQNALEVADGKIGKIEGTDQIVVRLVRKSSTSHRPRLGSADSSVSLRTRPGSSSSTMSTNSQISEDLQPTKPKDAYKSPFERKREKEIKKLGRKVSATQEAQLEEKQHLQKFTANIQEQQLQIIRKEIKSKLQSTKQQVNDQHAYVSNLKNRQSDPELIHQEKLVLKQLKKRMVKLERRLVTVDEKLEILQKDGQENSPVITKNESKDRSPSSKSIRGHSRNQLGLEEQYPQQVRRDGKVNTRQVLEILQQKEKKQEKAQDQIEQQRVIAIHQQIEVKEAATRQKLAEFREKLKRATVSKNAVPSEEKPEMHTKNSPTPRPGIELTPKLKLTHSIINTSSSSEETDEDLDSGRVSRAGFRSEYPKFRKTSPSRNDEDTFNFSPVAVVPSANPSPSVSQNPSPKYSAEEVKRSDRKSGTQRNKEVPNSRRGSASSQRSVANRWEEAYSSKTSVWTVASSLPNSDFTMGISRSALVDSSSSIPGYEDLGGLPNGSHYDSVEDSLSDLESDSNTDKSSVVPSGGGVKYLSDMESDSNTDKSSVTGSTDGFTSSVSSFVPSGGGVKYLSDMESDSNTDKSSVTGSTDDFTSSVSSFVPSGGGVKYSTPTSSVASINGNLSSSSGLGANIPPEQWSGSSINSHSSDVSTTSDGIRKKPENKSQYTPSEYMNRGHDDSFDAHKMSLNHKTFESALNSMLGIETPGPLTYSHEQYDEFARPSRQSKSDVIPTPYEPVAIPRASNSAEETNSRASSLDRQETLNSRTTSPWGPDAKNVSVSERLSHFLEMDPFQDTTKPKIGNSFEDSDLTFKKPRVAEDTAIDGPSGDWRKNLAKDKPKPDLDLDNYAPKIKALREEEREDVFMRSAKEQKERVQRIRKAQQAAKIIQTSWRKYRNSKHACR